MKLIAETAFHHEGDFTFMAELIGKICCSPADIVKVHMLMDIDQYMLPDHPIYETINGWLFAREQWRELIEEVESSGKGLMTLVNDVAAAEFAAQFSPDLVELHSVALNDYDLICAVKSNISLHTPVVLGVGGSTLYEIENAIREFSRQKVTLMFGFQNFPTRYEDVNFQKMHRVMAAFPECSFGYADHTAWNEPSNVLISLLGAAQNMDYLEKHVTTHWGSDRTDYSAAVSFEMLDEIHQGLNVLSSCRGDGALALNAAERSYCVPGFMKKTAVLARDIGKGEILNWQDMRFLRTGQATDLSQLDAWSMVGKELVSPVASGEVLKLSHFTEETL